MPYRQARLGAVLAGAILFAMPVAELALGLGVAGPVHFVVGTLGLALAAAGLSGRIR